ncbi:hypothetical protein BDY19DRAFT_923186 [Irpex rosettiformis]|uniref:Uncharacterized protein n=1 Tax=Irpex rosettiformis TaxID=378272 RepID=A0ACB8UGA0_9APHY|nr:hypothetical protein BDY19DRAFT_923186 [Irpex rosettiformis]
MENTDSTSTPEQRSPLQSLEDQIALLTEINTNIQSLRRPTSFFQPAEIASGLTVGGGVVQIYHDPPIETGFKQVKALAEKLQSKPVQEALKAAKESATKEPIGLSLGRRRRHPPKRPVTPESPPPLRSFQPKTLSFFPPDSDHQYPPLCLDDFAEYAKDYNRKGRFHLQIWTATKHDPNRPLPDPPIVRFVIPDVFTVYMTLGTISPGSSVIVESATAFGSREKKPPHAQSDFVVFQSLSQHLVKILQSKPQASFQSIVNLLEDYEDLFVRACVVCGRLITGESHVPPVVRTWRGTPPPVGKTSLWDARHPLCLD